MNDTAEKMGWFLLAVLLLFALHEWVVGKPPQAPLPPQAPPVRGIEPCPCSPACTCGCNEGALCQCGEASGRQSSVKRPENPSHIQDGTVPERYSQGNRTPLPPAHYLALPRPYVARSVSSGNC